MYEISRYSSLFVTDCPPPISDVSPANGIGQRRQRECAFNDARDEPHIWRRGGDHPRRGQVRRQRPRGRHRRRRRRRLPGQLPHRPSGKQGHHPSNREVGRILKLRLHAGFSKRFLRTNDITVRHFNNGLLPGSIAVVHWTCDQPEPYKKDMVLRNFGNSFSGRRHSLLSSSSSGSGNTTFGQADM